MKSNSQESFFVYGRQPVIEALKAGTKIYELWLAKEQQGSAIRQIQNLAGKRGLSTRTVRKDELQKLVGPVVHQGVVMRSAPGRLLSHKQFELLLDKSEAPIFLVLDQIQDPHNLGAILRTADITNVDAVILTEKGSADLSATVAKTSAGAIFHVPVYRVDKIQPVLQRMQDKDIHVYAMSHTADNMIYQADLKKGLAVIIGNEGRGVRKNLLSFCQSTLRIPQFGKINSLNASVSAAVVLYEVVRQRKFT